MIIFLLIIIVPILMVVSPVFNLYSLHLGDLDINLADMILFLAILFLGVRWLTIARSLPCDMQKKKLLEKINNKIIIFCIILLSTTVIYSCLLSSKNFIFQIVSLSRFVFQVSIYFVLINLIIQVKHLKSSYIYFNCLGYVFLFSSYFSTLFFSVTGEIIGEIQSNENGVRYFGLIGDQLGFIGLLFIFISLINHNKLNALIWVITVIATGTRGAIVSLIVGLIIYYFPKRYYLFDNICKFFVNINFYIVILCLFMSYLFFQEYIDMQIESLIKIMSDGLERIINISGDNFSANQRQLTWQLAIRVFLNNPLIGVGYSGFRFAALKSGAVELLTGYDVANSTATASNQYLQVATDAGLIGIVVFVSLFSSIFKLLKLAIYCTIPELSKFFMAGRIWLWSLLIGNQTAAWLVPGSLINYLFWLILGMAAATVAIESDASKLESKLEPINYRL